MSLLRVAFVAPAGEVEEARALLLVFCPEGFEELGLAGGAVELAAYVEPARAERIGAAFADATATAVAPDWHLRWRRFHRGARVGPLWIGPPWEEAPADAAAVVIDPGRAFGTGAHATTRLCLRLLLELEPAPLLDVGCGSGVLSIAGARLGFGPVVALDNDPAAVEAAVANASLNHVKLEVRLVDALATRLPGSVVVVANVSLDAVAGLSGRLDARFVVTSGYLEHDQPRFAGFQHVARRTLDGWAADLHARRTQ